MTDNDTQLTPASGYDVDRMIFSEPQEGTIPNSKPEIKFKRINISTRNEDGSVGELILPTERLFSFGVSENLSQETKEVNGYVMPLCLWNRDGVSKPEKQWSDTFDAIVEKCKDHLVTNREEIEHYDLERNDLKKLNPLYWKKEKGKVVEGTGPTLYAKLMVSKKQDNKIITEFFKKGSGETLNGMDLLGKYCYATGAVKIESIFIGSKISLQVKLYECEVELMQRGTKKLLPRPKASTRVLTGPTSNTGGAPLGDDDETGSLDGDMDNLNVEDAEEEAAPPKEKPKLVKKTRKVIRKKAPAVAASGGD